MFIGTITNTHASIPSYHACDEESGLLIFPRQSCEYQLTVRNIAFECNVREKSLPPFRRNQTPLDFAKRKTDLRCDIKEQPCPCFVF